MFERLLVYILCNDCMVFLFCLVVEVFLGGVLRSE